MNWLTYLDFRDFPNCIIRWDGVPMKYGKLVELMLKVWKIKFEDFLGKSSFLSK